MGASPRQLSAVSTLGRVVDGGAREIDSLAARHPLARRSEPRATAWAEVAVERWRRSPVAHAHTRVSARCSRAARRCVALRGKRGTRSLRCNLARRFHGRMGSVLVGRRRADDAGAGPAGSDYASYASAIAVGRVVFLGPAILPGLKSKTRATCSQLPIPNSQISIRNSLRNSVVR